MLQCNTAHARLYEDCCLDLLTFDTNARCQEGRERASAPRKAVAQAQAGEAAAAPAAGAAIGHGTQRERHRAVSRARAVADARPCALAHLRTQHMRMERARFAELLCQAAARMDVVVQ